MDENVVFNQYALEKILSMLGKLSDGVDLLTLMGDENQSNIMKKLTSMDSKIDEIRGMLSQLVNDFSELKKENRDIEQKIYLMNSKLTKLEQRVPSDEFEAYSSMAQRQYDNWDALEPLTKRFIPLAEYLYSQLQKLEDPDYSPVIIELCRAIENEFLLKIFRKYTLDLIDRYNDRDSLSDFLSDDRSSRELSQKTGVFAKAITRAFRTLSPEYTLGQMNTILSLCGDSSIVSRSPLLQDFIEYLRNNMEAAELLDSDYISKINAIVNNYRNPSAHPEYMPREKAEECKDIMPERIDYLMDCV